MVSQREHIDAVASQTGQPVTVVAAILREHLATVSTTVAAGEKVTLSGFGTFYRDERPYAKTAVPAFKPGARLTRTVQDPPPAKKTAAKGTATTTTAKKTAAKKSATKKTAAKRAPHQRSKAT